MLNTPEGPRQFTLHRFPDSLARSQSFAKASWWEHAYRAGVPGFQSMTYVSKDGWAQRGGIDRIVTLRSGKTVTIDEKVRMRAWPDILLERWSDRDRRNPGWVQRDLACDYVAYTFVETQTCHLLPFMQLRMAWLRHGRQWIKQYPTVLAHNRGYVTENIAVPIPVIYSAINEAMTFQWDSAGAA